MRRHGLGKDYAPVCMASCRHLGEVIIRHIENGASATGVAYACSTNIVAYAGACALAGRIVEVLYVLAPGPIEASSRRLEHHLSHNRRVNGVALLKNSALRESVACRW